MDYKENRLVDGTIDVMKLIMAILVVGIHTEPFGFNIWLDRGFGMITRLCVPFFFVVSAYFYQSNQKRSITKFLSRIFWLYFIWSIIYLPFDFHKIVNMSSGKLVDRFLWSGNEHALWYLCGCMIGFIIVATLQRFFSLKTIVFVSLFFLLGGCLKSTWAPLISICFNVTIIDWMGSRNGLFYAFPYIAFGMLVADKKKIWTKYSLKSLMYGFIASFCSLIIEAYVCVVILKTHATIMWISVVPYTVTFFMLCKKIKIEISEDKALLFRKLSILVYLSHCMFIPLFEKYVQNINLFVIVSGVSIMFGYVIILLSDNKCFSWLQYLYLRCPQFMKV